MKISFQWKTLVKMILFISGFFMVIGATASDGVKLGLPYGGEYPGSNPTQISIDFNSASISWHSGHPVDRDLCVRGYKITISDKSHPTLYLCADQSNFAVSSELLLQEFQEASNQLIITYVELHGSVYASGKILDHEGPHRIIGFYTREPL